jgi:hypothetical protein
MPTDVSEEHRLHFQGQKIILARNNRATCFHSIFSILNMEAFCSSETPVDTQRTTRRYIPEDGTLQKAGSSEDFFFNLDVRVTINFAYIHSGSYEKRKGRQFIFILFPFLYLKHCKYVNKNIYDHYNEVGRKKKLLLSRPFALSLVNSIIKNSCNESVIISYIK